MRAMRAMRAKTLPDHFRYIGSSGMRESGPFRVPFIFWQKLFTNWGLKFPAKPSLFNSCRV